MQLTKHEHACVVLTKDGASLLIDPGTFNPDAEQLLAAADAVFITHEHPDHYVADTLRAALDARPELHAYGPSFVARDLGERDGQVVTVAPGDALSVAGFDITAHGGTHAVIHPDVPTVDNVGLIFDGNVYHPGDSYSVPDAAVQTLLVPTSGPWAKLSEAVDFVRAVKPQQSIQIHELMLSELGQGFFGQMLGAEGLTGIPMTTLPPGESTEV